MAGEKRSIICCDFDGVINSYRSGWLGACVIPDDPVPGALEWLAMMVHDHYNEFEVCIYSSRSKEPGAVDAMVQWLKKHFMVFYEKLDLSLDELEPAAMSVIEGLSFPTQKPAANMMIDDRGFRFDGTFPTPEWIRGFKPWNKKSLEIKLGLVALFAPAGKAAYEGFAKARDHVPFAPWETLTESEQYVWIIVAKEACSSWAGMAKFPERAEEGNPNSSSGS